MTQFRTIEISDPQYECENLRYLTVKSKNIKGRGDITIFVPPNSPDPIDLPIVILLHGVYASHWAWTRLMNVHNTVWGMIENGEINPMVLAMPSDGLWGDGSGYLLHSGYDFEKWIIDDVIGAVTQTIDQLGKNSPKFITGLSMGGYGALRLGSKYPEIFTAFSGHSSITDIAQMNLFVEEDLRSYLTNENNDESVIRYMLENKQDLLPFRFDCGTEDQLIEYNRNLHQALNNHGIDHIYEEFPGEHNVSYWGNHIKRSILFFNQYLCG